MRRLVTVAVLVAALGAAAPVSVAEFTPLPPPPGVDPTVNTGADPIDGFAVSGDAWIAFVLGSGLWLTTDEGANWRSVKPCGDLMGTISVASDGAFWLAGKATYDGAAPLTRVTPAGDVTCLNVPSAFRSAPAWDDRGRMWVAGNTGTFDAPVTTAARVDASGNVVEQVSAKSEDTGLYYIRFVGGAGYVGHSTEVFRLAGGKLTLISGHADQPAEFVTDNLWPEADAGRALLAFRGISLDHGATFGKTTRQQFGVYGNPQLLVRHPLVGSKPVGIVVKRCNDWIFCETGLEVPAGTGAVWQAKDGLVAVGLDADAPTGPIAFNEPYVFAMHHGALPPVSVPGGAVPKGARALIARVNGYRHDAGLLPLHFDAAMSRAAYNHARYVVRNHLSLAEPATVHLEQKGKPGFTGEKVGRRCAAAGTECDTEDLAGGARPVDTIMSSYYHRLIAAAPYTQFGGAATYKGVTAFVFNAARGAIPLRPSGFPSGRYRGPLGLRGREVPNPLDVCRPGILTEHPGVPVTFEPPGLEPARPVNFGITIREGPDVNVYRVSLFQGRRRVPGCGYSIGGFIATHPLRPHTRYTAKARWKQTPKSPWQTYTWSFRTR